MSITKIATVQTANTSGGTDANITVPTGVLPNHLGVLAIAAANSSAGTFPVPPPAPAGWTARINPANGSTGTMWLFTRLGGHTAGDTLTVTQPTSNGATTTAIWYDTGGRDISYSSAEWDTAAADVTTMTFQAPGQPVAADVILAMPTRTATANSLPAPTGTTLDFYGVDSSWLCGAFFGHALGVTSQSYSSTWTPSAATSHNAATMQFALHDLPSVFLRATATAGGGATTNLSSLTITIPSTAKIGDIAVMTLGIVNNTSTLTTPTGWTVVDNTTDASGTAAAGWLLTKTIASGDPGSSVSLTFSNTCHPTATMRVYANATLTGAQLNKTAYGTTAATTFTLPTVTLVPTRGMVDVSIVARTSANATNVPAPTAPGGYALAGHASTAIASSTAGWSTALSKAATTDGASYGGETLTTTQSSTAVAWTYVLAPSTRPLLVATYNDSSMEGTAASHTASVTCAPGDVLLYCAWSGGGGVAPQAPSGGSLTWLPLVSGNSSSTGGNAQAAIFVAYPTSSQTFTVTGTVTGANAGNATYGNWGFQVQRWANTAGPSTSQWGVSGSTTGQISFTQTTPNSTLAMVISDYNGVGGASRVYVTSSAGTFTETIYDRPSNGMYTAYAGYYPNDGAQASKTVGISAPTGTLDAMAVVELLPLTTDGTLARESWNGTNGAAWPGQWVTSTNNTGAATIQTNSGQLGFGNVSSYAFGASGYLPALSTTDSETTVTVTFQQIQEEYLFIAARSDGTRSAGYTVEIQPGNGTSSLAVCKQSSGATSTSLSGWVTGGQWTANVPRKVRFKVQGSTLSVKVWDASVAEPASWTWTGTDSTYTGPGTCMVFTSTGSTVSGGTVRLNGLTITDTTSSVLYTETFPGVNGSAWPSAFWTADNSGGSIAQNGSGGGTLTTTSTGTYVGGDGAIFTAIQRNAFDVTYDVQVTNAEQYVNLIARFPSGDTSLGNGYDFQYNPGSGLRVVTDVSGGWDNSLPFSGAIWASTVRVRCRAIGNILRMKAWDATQAEPAAWTYQRIDTANNYTNSSGNFAFQLVNGAVAGALTATVSNVVLNDAGVTESGHSYTGAPADNEGITDAVSTVRSVAQAPADNVGLTDSVTVVRTVVQSVADNVGVTDVASVTHVGSGADNVGVTDARTVVQGLVRAPADNVGLTDSVTFVRQVFQTKADNVGVTDTATTQIAKTPVVPTDPVGLTDSVTTVMSRVRTVADTIGIEDATAAAGQMFLPIVTTAAPDVESRSSLEDVVNLSATIGVTVNVATADLEVGPQRATIGIGAHGNLTRIISLSGAPTGVISMDMSSLRVVHKMTDIVSIETVGVIQQMMIHNGPIYPDPTLGPSATGAWESGVYGPSRQRIYRMTRNENVPVGWGAYIAADAFENIPAGSEVTVSLWYRATGGGGPVHVQVVSDDGSDSPDYGGFGGGVTWTVTPDGTWQQLTETFTLAKDWLAAVHRLRMELPLTGSGDFVEWSDATLTITYIPSPPGPPTPPPPPPTPIVARVGEAQVGFALVAPATMALPKKMVKRIARIFSVLR